MYLDKTFYKYLFSSLLTIHYILVFSSPLIENNLQNNHDTISYDKLDIEKSTVNITKSNYDNSSNNVFLNKLLPHDSLNTTESSTNKTKINEEEKCEDKKDLTQDVVTSLLPLITLDGFVTIKDVIQILNDLFQKMFPEEKDFIENYIKSPNFSNSLKTVYKTCYDKLLLTNSIDGILNELKPKSNTEMINDKNKSNEKNEDQIEESEKLIHPDNKNPEQQKNNTYPDYNKKPEEYQKSKTSKDQPPIKYPFGYFDKRPARWNIKKYRPSYEKESYKSPLFNYKPKKSVGNFSNLQGEDDTEHSIRDKQRKIIENSSNCSLNNLIIEPLQINKSNIKEFIKLFLEEILKLQSLHVLTPLSPQQLSKLKDTPQQEIEKELNKHIEIELSELVVTIKVEHENDISYDATPKVNIPSNIKAPIVKIKKPKNEGYLPTKNNGKIIESSSQINKEHIIKNPKYKIVKIKKPKKHLNTNFGKDFHLGNIKKLQDKFKIEEVNEDTLTHKYKERDMDYDNSEENITQKKLGSRNDLNNKKIGENEDIDDIDQENNFGLEQTNGWKLKAIGILKDILQHKYNEREIDDDIDSSEESNENIYVDTYSELEETETLKDGDRYSIGEENIIMQKKLSRTDANNNIELGQPQDKWKFEEKNGNNFPQEYKGRDVDDNYNDSSEENEENVGDIYQDTHSGLEETEMFKNKSKFSMAEENMITQKKQSRTEANNNDILENNEDIDGSDKDSGYALPQTQNGWKFEEMNKDNLPQKYEERNIDDNNNNSLEENDGKGGDIYVDTHSGLEETEMFKPGSKFSMDEENMITQKKQSRTEANNSDMFEENNEDIHGSVKGNSYELPQTQKGWKLEEMNKDILPQKYEERDIDDNDEDSSEENDGKGGDIYVDTHSGLEETEMFTTGSKISMAEENIITQKKQSRTEANNNDIFEENNEDIDGNDEDDNFELQQTQNGWKLQEMNKDILPQKYEERDIDDNDEDSSEENDGKVAGIYVDTHSGLEETEMFKTGSKFSMAEENIITQKKQSRTEADNNDMFEENNEDIDSSDENHSYGLPQPQNGWKFEEMNKDSLLKEYEERDIDDNNDDSSEENDGKSGGIYVYYSHSGLEETEMLKTGSKHSMAEENMITQKKQSRTEANNNDMFEENNEDIDGTNEDNNFELQQTQNGLTFKGLNKNNLPQKYEERDIDDNDEDSSEENYGKATDIYVNTHSGLEETEMFKPGSKFSMAEENMITQKKQSRTEANNNDVFEENNEDIDGSVEGNSYELPQTQNGWKLEELNKDILPQKYEERDIDDNSDDSSEENHGKAAEIYVDTHSGLEETEMFKPGSKFSMAEENIITQKQQSRTEANNNDMFEENKEDIDDNDGDNSYELPQTQNGWKFEEMNKDILPQRYEERDIDDNNDDSSEENDGKAAGIYVDTHSGLEETEMFTTGSKFSMAEENMITQKKQSRTEANNDMFEENNEDINNSDEDNGYVLPQTQNGWKFEEMNKDILPQKYEERDIDDNHNDSAEENEVEGGDIYVDTHSGLEETEMFEAGSKFSMAEENIITQKKQSRTEANNNDMFEENNEDIDGSDDTDEDNNYELPQTQNGWKFEEINKDSLLKKYEERDIDDNNDDSSEENDGKSGGIYVYYSHSGLEETEMLKTGSKHSMAEENMITQKKQSRTEADNNMFEENNEDIDDGDGDNSYKLPQTQNGWKLKEINKDNLPQKYDERNVDDDNNDSSEENYENANDIYVDTHSKLEMMQTFKHGSKFNVNEENMKQSRTDSNNNDTSPESNEGIHSELEIQPFKSGSTLSTAKDTLTHKKLSRTDANNNIAFSLPQVGWKIDGINQNNLLQTYKRQDINDIDPHFELEKNNMFEQSQKRQSSDSNDNDNSEENNENIESIIEDTHSELEETKTFKNGHKFSTVEENALTQKKQSRTDNNIELDGWKLKDINQNVLQNYKERDINDKNNESSVENNENIGDFYLDTDSELEETKTFKSGSKFSVAEENMLTRKTQSTDSNNDMLKEKDLNQNNLLQKYKERSDYDDYNNDNSEENNENIGYIYLDTNSELEETKTFKSGSKFNVVEENMLTRKTQSTDSNSDMLNENYLNKNNLLQGYKERSDYEDDKNDSSEESNENIGDIYLDTNSELEETKTFKSGSKFNVVEENMLTRKTQSTDSNSNLLEEKDINQNHLLQTYKERSDYEDDNNTSSEENTENIHVNAYSALENTKMFEKGSTFNVDEENIITHKKESRTDEDSSNSHLGENEGGLKFKGRNEDILTKKNGERNINDNNLEKNIKNIKGVDVNTNSELEEIKMFKNGSKINVVEENILTRKKQSRIDANDNIHQERKKSEEINKDIFLEKSKERNADNNHNDTSNEKNKNIQTIDLSNYSGLEKTKTFQNGPSRSVMIEENILNHKTQPNNEVNNNDSNKFIERQDSGIEELQKTDDKSKVEFTYEDGAQIINKKQSYPLIDDLGNDFQDLSDNNKDLNKEDLVLTYEDKLFMEHHNKPQTANLLITNERGIQQKSNARSVNDTRDKN